MKFLLKCEISQKIINGLLFRASSYDFFEELVKSKGKIVDIIGTAEENIYNGKTNFNLIIQDMVVYEPS